MVYIFLEVTFIVSVANDNKLPILFELLNMDIGEGELLQLLGDHVLLGVVDGGKIDVERDRAASLVRLPESLLQLQVERRLACS